MIRIEVPFPPSILSPNSRAHWARKLKSKKAQKEHGFYASLPHRGKVSGNLSVSLKFYPQDARARDRDNAVASLKAALDGVALGLGVDDRTFTTLTVRFGEPARLNPRVEIEIG